MDTFIDKLAQRFSAQDMIRANLAAEAKETRKLREKMESYESLLQEMRQINLKNMESAERVNLMLQEGATADKAYLQELFTKADENLHTENVKVYRNVQAVVVDEVKKQTDAMAAQNEELKTQNQVLQKQNKSLRPLIIVTLLAALANIGLVAAQIAGLF